MSERRDAFERDLARRLRAWTDVAERRALWADEAHEVLATAGGPGVRSRWTILALGMGAIAAIVVSLVVVSLPNFFQAPRGTAGLTNAPATQLPTFPNGGSIATPGHSVSRSGELDLSEIGWWDQLSIGFGTIPEFTPEPNPAVQPASFRQVRIGTLDGRVTAMLAVHDAWGHSYVSGPTRGDVIVAHDHGTFSTVRAVTAATGEIRILLDTTDLVTAAALSPSGELYYARLDRSTMRDGTVWRRDPATGAEVLLDRAPSAFGSEDHVNVWQLAAAPDGRTLVAQYCFGEISCITRVIDLQVGSTQETDAIGWVQGFGDREMYGYRVSQRGLITVDLDTLEVTDGAPIPPQDDIRPGSFGVELPDEWRAIWAYPPGDSIRTGEEPLGVELVDMGSGERRQSPPLLLEWPDEGCDPIRPEELPSGRPPGTSVMTLEDGVQQARWGKGDDAVSQIVGVLTDVESPEDVVIRGQRGWLMSWGAYPGPPGRQVRVILWTESDCSYLVILPEAMTLEEAREYAPRF